MSVDAAVIGSGPNALVAATLLARAGWSVEVLEAAPTAGGAIGSEAGPMPGVVHDWGAAFFGILRLGPVWDALELGRRLRWADAETPVAATWQPGSAALLHRDATETAAGLGIDRAAWAGMVADWHAGGSALYGALLGPLPSWQQLRVASSLGLRGGLRAAAGLLEPASAYAARTFRGSPARALLLGHATHGDVPVDGAGSLPPALLLTLAAQTVGMPVPVGGTGRLAAALCEAAEEAGARVTTGDAVVRVEVASRRAVGVVTASGRHISVRRAVLAGCAPLPLSRDLVGEQHLPADWMAAVTRYRHGPTGYFRLDVDLAGPAPWAASGLSSAAVVHVLGADPAASVRLAQAQARSGELPAVPPLVVGQQDEVDASRVPDSGARTLWVECHAPSSGWTPARREQMADLVLGALETAAPGVAGRVLALTARSPADIAARDPTLRAGDVGGGSASPDQLAIFRPAPGWRPYRTPVRGLWLCSSAAPPGGGAHGLVGWAVARAVLRTPPPAFAARRPRPAVTPPA